ncbi:hypothetical protein [Aquabacterium sp.]|uniref:hypothetical protein n=1 Tax=Aquabacterium sp. TaxID=1872578 RepID=UPI002489D1CA|nr:hypothetical protein [Aquabacterium sp.]MDI1258298.1 hypothetical protein [Aquabacterium sp.]
MQPRAKTIQIFLPSGDPQGIRQAEITTRIVRLIEVPRALLKDERIFAAMQGMLAKMVWQQFQRAASVGQG